MKRLTLIFLFLFALSTLVEVCHHHDDGENHDDCPICIAAYHHSAANFGVFSLAGLPQSNSIEETPFVSSRYNPIHVVFLPGRAPPA
jgi:hypothetical protein